MFAVKIENGKIKCDTYLYLNMLKINIKWRFVEYLQKKGWNVTYKSKRYYIFFSKMKNKKMNPSAAESLDKIERLDQTKPKQFNTTIWANDNFTTLTLLLSHECQKNSQKTGFVCTDEMWASSPRSNPPVFLFYYYFIGNF